MFPCSRGRFVERATVRNKADRMIPKGIHTEMSGCVDKFTWIVWVIGCFFLC